jgi:glycogen debranching enzyme
MPSRARSRTIQPSPAAIVAATDLGSVEVAKHGNLYLLTDPRGDIRVDGRGLGLYELDTRILSTSILRLNGAPLTLLRGPRPDDRGADTIQLTNPELRRNPDDKRAAASGLAHRELSLTRTRRLDGTLREELAVVNYSASTEDVVLELGLGADMADIFEVRGYPRTARGALLPIELRADRVVFAYDGLDGGRRTTTVVFDGGRCDPAADAAAWPGTTVVATWRARLQPNER